MSGSSAVIELLGKLGGVLSSISGVGFWLFLVGFTLILVLAMAFLVRLLINLVKLIPNMTVNQLIKFVLVTGIVLMIVGLFVP
jgi:vacuolar-type H+-ATPase subunit I/STV1